jgi:hypothetical protein
MWAELRFVCDQQCLLRLPSGPRLAVVGFDPPLVGNDQPRRCALALADWPAAADGHRWPRVRSTRQPAPRMCLGIYAEACAPLLPRWAEARARLLSRCAALSGSFILRRGPRTSWADPVQACFRADEEPIFVGIQLWRLVAVLGELGELGGGDP